MLILVYVTGISAFSILYLKMFIWSRLVKRESLNIRIYSDSNNNYFYNNVLVKKNALYLKNCVIYNSVLHDEQFSV